MHGLIFAPWEKYLAERFGTVLLNKYREVTRKGRGNQHVHCA